MADGAERSVFQVVALSILALLVLFLSPFILFGLAALSPLILVGLATISPPLALAYLVARASGHAQGRSESQALMEGRMEPSFHTGEGVLPLGEQARAGEEEEEEEVEEEWEMVEATERRQGLEWPSVSARAALAPRLEEAEAREQQQGWMTADDVYRAAEKQRALEGTEGGPTPVPRLERLPRGHWGVGMIGEKEQVEEEEGEGEGVLPLLRQPREEQQQVARQGERGRMQQVQVEEQQPPLLQEKPLSSAAAEEEVGGEVLGGMEMKRLVERGTAGGEGRPARSDTEERRQHPPIERQKQQQEQQPLARSPLADEREERQGEAAGEGYSPDLVRKKRPCFVDETFVACKAPSSQEHAVATGPAPTLATPTPAAAAAAAPASPVAATAQSLSAATHAAAPTTHAAAAGPAATSPHETSPLSRHPTPVAALAAPTGVSKSESMPEGVAEGPATAPPAAEPGVRDGSVGEATGTSGLVEEQRQPRMQQQQGIAGWRVPLRRGREKHWPLKPHEGEGEGECKYEAWELAPDKDLLDDAMNLFKLSGVEDLPNETLEEKLERTFTTLTGFPPSLTVGAVPEVPEAPLVVAGEGGGGGHEHAGSREARKKAAPKLRRRQARIEWMVGEIKDTLGVA